MDRSFDDEIAFKTELKCVFKPSMTALGGSALHACSLSISNVLTYGALTEGDDDDVTFSTELTYFLKTFSI